MKFEPRRIIGLILLFVTIAGVVMSFSESVLCAAEQPGVHETVIISHDYDTQMMHGNGVPSAPSQSRPTDDHACLDDCDCPCNAPLHSMPSISLINVHPLTLVYHTELNRYIPDVYLSLFVPPDSSIV